MITSELINLFNFLLPGFITSFVFYALIPFPKRSEFEAVIIALIWTVIINALIEGIGYIFIATGNQTYAVAEREHIIKTVLAIILAIVIGFLWSYFYNNDIIHRALRKFRITNQPSYPSEWYGAFSETNTYIVLYLKDERRIMGWPLFWPTYPQKGHFVLENARWLIDNNGKNDIIALDVCVKIMIDAANVEMVEFVQFDDKSRGEKNES
jgi:hypothetical protein